MTAQQIAATGIFLATFALILMERVHRLIAALIGAAAMLVAGILMHFYSQELALAAIDFGTIGLLLGMMILVQLLEQTGFFEYVAILTGKRSGGKPWLLLIVLGAATSMLSMVLDNVTTVVLIVPMTILMAQILGINPVPLLMAEALLSNIGGVATLVGDPPNVLIGSAAGLTFNAFLLRTAPLALVAWFVALPILYFVFRRELHEQPKDVNALAQLDERKALRDPVNLRRLLVVVGAVIVLFFAQGLLQLEPAVIALIGASVAMMWVRPDVDETLRHVEWGVLLFFAALFVTVGGLQASGVLHQLTNAVAGLARTNPLLASLALLWIAAIISAMVDNVPFTIAVIPVILELGGLGIPVTALWWALALGAGLGGNGTPIGATANVITVAQSERTRTPITTRIWLRSGLPVMLATCIVVSILFAVFFAWMQKP